MITFAAKGISTHTDSCYESCRNFSYRRFYRRQFMTDTLINRGNSQRQNPLVRPLLSGNFP
jgi:hypothetical protein